MEVRHYRPNNRPKGRRTPAKKSSKLVQRLKGISVISLLLGLPLLVMGVVFLLWYATAEMPSVVDARELQFAESTIIYDRGALESGANPADHVLYTIHGDENRDYVPLADISAHVINATIAIEDDKFWTHWGFDVGGMTKAVLSELGLGKQRGGSTITQQLIKNSFLNAERSWTRKFKELVLAVKMEGAYEKEEILELYLNKIPYGNNAYGIQAAAMTYFAKSASELTLAEAATLASLPVAPTRFNPYREDTDELLGYANTDGTWAKGRKDLVLDRMLALEMITADEHAQAFTESQNLDFRRALSSIRSPHFVFAVKEQLAEKYGEELVETGGLRIYTTLDSELQSIAEGVVTERTAEYGSGFRAHNAALAAIDPSNGYVVAYVGNRDFNDTEHDGQVDVLQAWRQPGSSFKPFVFASAFESGYSPGTVLFDVETDFGGNYTPQNYDGTFDGPVRARLALNKSLNIPAIKMAYLAGVENVIKLGQAAGIQFQDPAADHGVAIGVGVAEVQPLSMIAGYQVFAGDGSYFEPTLVAEVRDSRGNVLETDDAAERARIGIGAVTAAMVRNILTDQETRPQNWNKYLQLDGINNGAKTGTTNRGEEPSDSWTIGFSSSLVSGVWVGNNDGRTMAGGATGLAVAAPIWKQFNEAAHASLIERGLTTADKEYDEPVQLAPAQINKFSGNKASNSTPGGLIVTEYFDPENMPETFDNSTRSVTIDTATGRIATDETPETLRATGTQLVLHSVLRDKSNWENPVQKWMANNTRFTLSGGADTGEIEQRDQREIDALYAEALLAEQAAKAPVVVYPPQLARPVTGNTTPITPTPSQPISTLELKVLSPTDGQRVSEKLLPVRVSPRSLSGIQDVVVFINANPMRRMTVPPWQTRVDISEQLDRGVPFTLRVVATDTAGNIAERSIRVVPER